MTIVKTTFWLALSVWLGALVFFSAIVAPALFHTLPRALAGEAVGAILPAYYRLGTVAGVMALGAVALLRRRFGRAGASTGLVAMLAMMLAATVYTGRVIQPRAHELRPVVADPAARAEDREEFERLHRRAVQLNGAVLLLGIACVVVAARSFRLPGE